MKSDIRKDEIRLLEFCADGPSLGVSIEKYRQWFGDADDDRRVYITGLAQWEMDNGFVIPLSLGDTSSPAPAYQGHKGISPLGVERLRRLKHPTAWWIGQNWFPISVATVTVLTGLASTTVAVVALVIGR